MSNSGVRCWGSTLVLPETDVLTGVKAIATGSSHTCARMNTGGVRCWGGNDDGQLGDGSLTSQSTPATTDILTGVMAIAAGFKHTCALMDTGGVRCWGRNDYGQLGASSNPDCADSLYIGHGIYKPVDVLCRTSPPTVDVLTGVRSIAAGYNHTCALMETGGVRCWGSNSHGQLGYPSKDTCARTDFFPDGRGIVTTAEPCASSPPTSDTLTGVRSIAAGYDHTCALMETGSVRCWGYNYFGQLGDGTTIDRSTPPEIDVLADVQAIAAGHDCTCALTVAGGVRCWGINQHGELGNGTTIDTAIPPTSDVITGVQGIATAADYTSLNCALMVTGGVRCWGDDNLTPVQVAGTCE
jgi:alpha-tubulin suppressor-like RCC1 family protein